LDLRRLSGGICPVLEGYPRFLIGGSGWPMCAELELWVRERKNVREQYVNEQEFGDGRRIHTITLCHRIGGLVRGCTDCSDPPKGVALPRPHSVYEAGLLRDPDELWHEEREA